MKQPNEKETEALTALFLKTEREIINEIGRLRSRGLIDYHAVAALKRVQSILKKLQSESWVYVPRMIEEMFYVKVPEAYTRWHQQGLTEGKTSAEHC